jgi:low affinity Fe/Cu permease
MAVQRSSGRFDRFATATALLTGRAGAFVVSAVLIVLWAVAGPLFRFSDTWQLIANTATTIITFLMVFVIQNTINRDSLAVHIKLDELIRVTNEARNALVGVEEGSEEELRDIDAEVVRESGTTPGPSPEGGIDDGGREGTGEGDVGRREGSRQGSGRGPDRRRAAGA